MKLDSGRMYRQHNSSSYSIMISKPPRPPSWRDFVNVETSESPPKSKIPVPSSSPPSSSKPSRIPTAKRKEDKVSKVDPEFSNLGRIQQKSYSEGSDLSRLGISHGSSRQHASQHGHSHTLPNPHTSKSGSKRHHQHHHRSQGRLHRTTSQYNIEQADIPRIEHMTLANTKLQRMKGYGGSSDALDPVLYLDENHKRCERWLNEVHACQTFEEISESKLNSPTSQPSVLIPEEGLSENDLCVKTVDVCSASGSELDSVSVCAARRQDLSDKEREEHIRIGGDKINKQQQQQQSGGGKHKKLNDTTTTTSSHRHHYNKHHHHHHHRHHHHHHKSINSNTNLSNNNKNKSTTKSHHHQLPANKKNENSNAGKALLREREPPPLTVISASPKSCLDHVIQSSKENRDPSTVSSSSEEMIQYRNNRRNLSDHSGSSKGSRYAEMDAVVPCDPAKHIL